MVLLQQVQKKLHKIGTRLAQASMDKVLWERRKRESLKADLTFSRKPLGGSQTQQTFVMIKPDGVARCLTGEVIKRLESQGLKILAMKMLMLDKGTAERLYSVHRGKNFFEGLVEFVTSGPVVTMILEGENAVSLVRKTIGATDPAKAEPGTIRGDFGGGVMTNIIHAADSPENAKKEMETIFKPDEIFRSQKPTACGIKKSV